jgi:hypothetical protein
MKIDEWGLPEALAAGDTSTAIRTLAEHFDIGKPDWQEKEHGNDCKICCTMREWLAARRNEEETAK